MKKVKSMLLVFMMLFASSGLAQNSGETLEDVARNTGLFYYIILDFDKLLSNPEEYEPIEQDFLAGRITQQLLKKMEKMYLSDLYPMYSNYGTPKYAEHKIRACVAYDEVIKINKKAKEAAKLSSVGHYKPEYFDGFEVRFKKSQALVRCR